MEKSKAALVLGFGRSGKAAKGLLEQKGYFVSVYDDKIEGFCECDILKRKYDLCVISPGFSQKSPAFGIFGWHNQNTPVISEIDLGFLNAKAKIIGITGTNGKTTVTTLVKKVLEGKYNSYAVGNIGVPFCEKALFMNENDFAVCELSSFQLKTSRFVEIDSGVVLNITPDHMDIHRTFDDYLRCKNSIYTRIKRNGFAVINADDDNISCAFEGKKLYYSVRNRVEGAYLEKGWLCFLGKRVVHSERLKIKGLYNVANALCVICFACGLGIDIEEIARVLEEFDGLEHRNRIIARYNGIDFIDDSKATNVDAAIQAIKSCDKGSTAVILGGSDKDTDFSLLIKELFGIKLAVFMGETAWLLEKYAKQADFCNFVTVDCMENAVRLAYDAVRSEKCNYGCGAFNDKKSNDFYSVVTEDEKNNGYISMNAQKYDMNKINKSTVLLSPACASFDKYENYAARGCDFEEKVKKLIRQEECKDSGRK